MFRSGKVLLLIALIAMVGLLILSGCARKEVVLEERVKPVVAVTIVPQRAFVEAVCGDLVDIIVMVPPGNRPGNYEPTPQEMQRFSDAGIYFAIGVPTEAANIMPLAAEQKTLSIVRLHEEVATVYPDREMASGRRDAHIWLSPRRVKVMVEVIATEMGSYDPLNKDTYLANAQDFIAQLDKLDVDMKEALEGVQDGKFIVFHPAFGYLADDYGLTMYALEQDGKEATPQRLQEMIDLAKTEGIKAIFYQAEIASKQAEAFAEEIGGKTIQLAPLSPDYINNLSKMAKLLAEVMQ